jgi:hypothetical protein
MATRIPVNVNRPQLRRVAAGVRQRGEISVLIGASSGDQERQRWGMEQLRMSQWLDGLAGAGPDPELSDQDRHDVAAYAAWSVEDALRAMEEHGRRRTAARMRSVLAWAMQTLSGGVSA